MKKSIVYLIVTVMSLVTLVGCSAVDEAVNEQIPMLQVEATNEDYSTEEVIEEETEDEVVSYAKVEYNKEDIINALTITEGLTLNYNTEDYSMKMGIREDFDNKYVYYEIAKTFEGNKTNLGGFYVVNNDVYVYLSDNIDNHLIENHIIDKDNSYMESARADSIIKELQNPNDIKDVFWKENIDYEDSNYDVVTVFTLSDFFQDEYEKIEDNIKDLEDKGGGKYIYITDETGTERKVQAVELYNQELANIKENNTSTYYFNTATGLLDYIETKVDDEEVKIKVEHGEEFIEPYWFEGAEEIEEGNEDVMFTEMMSVMFLPFIDEPITVEDLEKQLKGRVTINITEENIDKVVEEQINGEVEEEDILQ